MLPFLSLVRCWCCHKELKQTRIDACSCCHIFDFNLRFLNSFLATVVNVLVTEFCFFLHKSREREFCKIKIQLQLFNKCFDYSNFHFLLQIDNKKVIIDNKRKHDIIFDVKTKNCLYSHVVLFLFIYTSLYRTNTH